MGPTWIQEDFRNQYSIIKELGAGQFGTAYQVIDRASGTKLACKSINKHQKQFNRKDVAREVEILNQLKGCRGIVGLVEVWEDSHSVHLVQELCEGGELFDVILERGHLTEADAATVARTLLEVVKSCHSRGILHRDLKPENWLLLSKLSKEQQLRSEDLRAIDFGLSVFLEPGQRLKQLAGSSYYMAPEVLKGDYGFEADLWSAGVIIYILLSGLPPFWGSSEKQIFRRILHEPLDLKTAPWPDISDAAKDLVSKLLTRDVSSRMNIDDALAHPWVQPSAPLPTVPLSATVFNRLKRFTEISKLKALLLNVVAAHLPQDSITQLRDMFHSMDKDHDGFIRASELSEAVQQLGQEVDMAAMQALLERMDLTSSGDVAYEEFLAAALNKKQLVTEQSLTHIFANLDRDGDGEISAAELLACMQECRLDISSEGLQALLLSEAGLAADVPITPEVFKRLMFDLAREDLIPGRLETFIDNAKTYTNNNNFKQLALMVIASTIPPEEVQELHELFTSIDEEESGVITYDQLRNALEIAQCNLAKEEVDALLAGLDVTRNGVISYAEFLAGALERQQMLSEAKLREAFNYFDNDGSGEISLEELQAALEGLEMDPEEAVKMMAAADADGNEAIDFEEFRALMMQSGAPNLVNRMASIATIGSLPAAGGLARSSMDPGLFRSSMTALGGRATAPMQIDPSLLRHSMAAPSLVRASMGQDIPASPLEDRMVAVESDWRMESFSGLKRPSITRIMGFAVDGEGGGASGLARPSLARPSMARPSMARPSMARPSLSKGLLGRGGDGGLGRLPTSVPE